MALENVGTLLCEQDNQGSFLLPLLDKPRGAATWNKKATSKIAHLMSLDFVKWLIKQAEEDKWSKEDVGSVVCRKNSDKQLILALLDEETQRRVAVFNKTKTCSAVPYMDEGEFLQWLHQEAIDGRWVNLQNVICFKETETLRDKFSHKNA